MNRLVITTLIVFIQYIGFSAGVETFEAKVKSGDNIVTFLARYKLEAHRCNIQIFKEMNNIKDINTLYAGKKYILPVNIQKLNGNIQKTTGIASKTALQRIMDYNSEIEKAGVKPKSHIKDNMVWIPLDETKCKKEEEVEDKKPSSSDTISNDSSSREPETIMKRSGVKTIQVPLMGSKYETVHIEDFSLQNEVYYIISGHGGPDPGAMSKKNSKNLCEDEYAYDVALRLARDLMQHGATVHMIVQDENDGIRDDSILPCDCDEVLQGDKTIPINQLQRLKDRVTLINRLYQKYKKQGVKVQKAIEIHVDSRSKNKRQDVFFYYNKSQKNGKKLAETVYNTFESKYAKHQKNRGYSGHVEDRSLYMVRNVAPTMLFVELANIKNPDDQKRLLINTNRQALANWLFEGLRKK